MPKITFMGAGSTVFAKNVLGDSMLTPALAESTIALYDIDATRLEESAVMLEAINRNNGSKARIEKYLGVENRRDALRGANYVVNAIQVGGYDPCTITDFEIPKKYGLEQTIADTLGVGGVMRALRTIPVMLDFARDIEDVCPDAWFLNYTNPMAMLTGGATDIDERRMKRLREAYDLYKTTGKHGDMVRLELMRRFGYYITESSEHNAEYTPYFIKKTYPELVDRWNVPLDEYPRRCVNQIADWKERGHELTKNPLLSHKRTTEYASYIMEAMETNVPTQIGGNVLNTGLITNLPQNACVEVPCLVDRNGVQPTVIGDLPEQCAAMNRTNINVQLLAIEAARTLKKDYIYQAVLMDPHARAELSIDDIVAMVDELIEAHGDWMPKFH